MNGGTVWDRPIVNPHLLTPNALKMLQNRYVNHVSDADWDSLADYMIRTDIVDSIVAGVFKHFNLTANQLNKVI